MVAIDAVWVNEQDEVRIDSSAPLVVTEEAEEEAGMTEFVTVVMMSEGIVVDALRSVTCEPFGVRFMQQTTSSAMSDEDFQLDEM